MKGRIGAEGQELQPLDEAALERIADTHRAPAVSAPSRSASSTPTPIRRMSAGPAKSCRAQAAGPDLDQSSEVSPQMREFERFNTVCANAYVRPQMADYLARLQHRLRDMGANCPVFMIHSGGGLISVETASEFPVRLVESGPAGGAIFAADIARRFGLDKVVSYDMGGTTAKICLIEDFAPQTARTFEVARTYRFRKGSGMPISIPVIEMIEIGAGGGSIAWVDAMGRIQTGPESAGSEPGPACYQRGGDAPGDHRRRPGPRQARSRQFRRRRHQAVGRGGRTRRSSAMSAQPLALDADVGRLRHLRGGRREHGQRRPCSCGRERQGHLRQRDDRLRRGGAAARRAAVREARDRPMPGPAGGGRRLGDRLPQGAVRLRGLGFPARSAVAVRRRTR